MTSPLPALALTLALGACASTPPVAAQPRLESVRVMSWNVNFGLLPTDAVLQQLRDADVDVVLLQETTPAWHAAFKRALKAPFKYQRHHAHPAAGGLSVLSKFPIEDDELFEPISWFPAERTVIKTPAGKVQTLNVHLRPPFDDSGNVVTGYFTTKSIRGEEMRSFVAALDPALPTVVAGDFNEASGEAVDTLDADGFYDALPRFNDDTTTWRWPVPVLGQVTGTLDHLFVDARLETVDAWVLELGESDHLPLVAWVQPASRASAAEGVSRPVRLPDPGSGYRVNSGSGL